MRQFRRCNRYLFVYDVRVSVFARLLESLNNLELGNQKPMTEIGTRDSLGVKGIRHAEFCFYSFNYF